MRFRDCVRKVSKCFVKGVQGRQLKKKPRSQLAVEGLEDRLTPTVIFHPYFGTEATTFGNGMKLNNTPVELIFWGSSYWNSPSGASASNIASAFTTLLASPAYQHLAQYNAGAAPYLAGWWIDNDHAGPVNNFTDGQLVGEIVNAINDPISPIHEPEFFGATPLYVVVTPFNTYVNENSLPGNGDKTVIGYHYDANVITNSGVHNLIYAWVGQPFNIGGLGGALSNRDTITSVFSHESSEAMTDAQPFSGITCNGGALLPSGLGGSGEIGDFEPEDYNLDDYRVDGVLVQAMWDHQAQAFTVSDGNSQHLDLTAHYTPNSGGSYSYEGSTLTIYGDQLGIVNGDYIALDATAAGGVEVTLNNESFAFEPGVQITEIDVLPGSGTNTIQINNLTAYCPVYVTGDGVNQVTIGNQTNGVQGILSHVFVYNGFPNHSSTGSSTLTIDDSADTVGRQVQVLDVDLGGGFHEGMALGMAPAEIDWYDNTDGAKTGGVNFLSIYGGSGGNTFYVFAGNLWFGTYIHSGSGDSSTSNEVDLESTASLVTVDGGDSQQSVYVSSFGSVPGGTLATIDGQIDVTNSALDGNSYLYIDDSGDSTGQTSSLQFGEFDSTGMPGQITWDTQGPNSGGVTYLKVNGGKGLNIVNILSTGVGAYSYYTVIDAGSGGSHVNVQSTQGSTYITNDGGTNVVDIGSQAPNLNGTLASINGLVGVSGVGASYLYIDDSGDASGRIANLGSVSLTGLSPANIYWTPASSFSSGVVFVEVYGSLAASTYNVLNTPGPYDLVALNTGPSNDVVNVQATTCGINIQNMGGTDNITVGSLAGALGGTVANINGAVDVYGPGINALTVDDSGDASPKKSTITSTYLTGLAPTFIYYGGAPGSSLTVYGGNGLSLGNVYNVQGTPFGRSVNIYMGNGAGTCNVGSTTHTLDPIQGNLTVIGQGGAKKLQINDQGSAASHTYTLTSMTLGRSGSASIVYGSIATLVVNGGNGGNTFIVSSIPPGAVTLAGGNGSNTLIGPNVNNTWAIKASNAGVLDNTIKFSSMGSLGGGTANDVFRFSVAGSLSGTVNGSGGANTLDYSAIGGLGIMVNLQTLAASAINSGLSDGFTNINTLIGNPSTASELVGTNADTIWFINGANGGNANGFKFNGITNLVGGSGVDTFKFAGAGSIGNIDGGAAPVNEGNWLDYSALATAISVNLAKGAASNVSSGVANIQNVRGGNGGNTLVGDSQGNILVGGTGADAITGGSGASILIGGKGADHVTGGSGGDILIGCSTAYDANNSVLMSFLAEWQSANSYAVRVAHLRQGGGLNGPKKLIFGNTVTDDGSADVVAAAPASLALDWFFGGSLDTFVNVESGEHINNQ
jgi:hypothetical protein